MSKPIGYLPIARTKKLEEDVAAMDAALEAVLADAEVSPDKRNALVMTLATRAGLVAQRIKVALTMAKGGEK